MGGTCYGVRATLLVTDEKDRIARSGRPKKRPMLRIIGLRMFARAVCPPYVRSLAGYFQSTGSSHKT